MPEATPSARMQRALRVGTTARTVANGGLLVGGQGDGAWGRLELVLRRQHRVQQRKPQVLAVCAPLPKERS